ncbi:MAG: TonB family protein [Betaproteobacteria bacterium]|nr:TonB family protein [Betaproteobacteria bacterium]NBY70966.1 TonB family protein [Betaproteobacteria bacterium]
MLLRLRSLLAPITPLQWALGISLLVHAGLLTLRFTDPETFNRIFQDTPLEVVLVNARSTSTPNKAQAIAQANLEGGGTLLNGRAASPLPPALINSLGDTLEDQSQPQVKTLQARQQQLLAQVRQQIASLLEKKPEPDTQEAEEQAAEIKKRQLLRQLAEIERRIQEDNTGPKKRYISPSTREEVFALYYDRLRRTVEDKGTSNFPQAGGQKLYGELTMVVTVQHDGQILDTDIVDGSGNPQLDRYALAIVRQAGPFGKFSPAMRQQADQIVVVSRFKFTRDDTLETRVSTPAAAR